MKKLLASVLFLSLITPAHSFSLKLKKEDPFPACSSPDVVERILKRFNKTEEIYWEKRRLVLTTVKNRHIHSENPFKESQINRRYCHGDAVFENGKKRRIHFLIEEGAGFAGYTWNVEYCIHGLDPWKYHDSYCRVLSQ